MARKAQEGTLEFLLINHPLDCPMCDKGGECPLQDQALKHGANTSRFIDQKRRYDKPVAVSPQVLLDRERCVLCARCTRFSEQISGDPFIELFERGALEQVAIYEDEPYESYFSGNVIQICPVGALTSTDYRFKARPFDVVTTPSVCDHCSAGCTLTVQSRRGTIQRQLARTNMAVNEAWNCDKGRFGYHHLTAATRLTTPQVRDGDGARRHRLDARAAARRRGAAGRAGGRARPRRGADRVAAGRRGRLPRRQVRPHGARQRRPRRPHPVRAAAETDELPRWSGRDTATYADVEHAPVIVVAGLDPEEEVPILHLRLRKAWRAHTARIVVVGPTSGRSRGSPGATSRPPRARKPPPCAPSLDPAGRRARRGPARRRRPGRAGRRARRRRRDHRRCRARGGRRRQARLRPTARRRARRDRGGPAGRRAARGPPARRPGRPGGGRGALGRAAAAERGRDLHAILTDAAAGRIDVLHLIGVDLARDAASPELARAALERVETVIVQDLAATETVRDFADVVLPAAGTQERAGSRTNWEGRTQRFARAVDAPGLVQEDWEILVQLAALLGHDLGVNDLDGVRGELDGSGRAAPHAWPAAPTPRGRRTRRGRSRVRPARRRRAARCSRGRCCSTAARCSPAPTTCSPPRARPPRPCRRGRRGARARRRRPGRAHRRRALAHAAGRASPPTSSPGVVLVPTNSTEVPAAALTGATARRVTLTR
jgi:NADH-quinone oxidoreductase subunit G